MLTFCIATAVNPSMLGTVCFTTTYKNSKPDSHRSSPLLHLVIYPNLPLCSVLMLKDRICIPRRRVLIIPHFFKHAAPQHLRPTAPRTSRPRSNSPPLPPSYLVPLL